MSTKTQLRHDLTDHALVGHCRREGDDGGPLVAVWFDDPEAGVKLGLRIRTAAQARALVEAAQVAQAELAAAEMEHEGAYLGEPEILLDRRSDEPRRTEPRRFESLGRRAEDLGKPDLDDLDPDAWVDGAFERLARGN